MSACHLYSTFRHDNQIHWTVLPSLGSSYSLGIQDVLKRNKELLLRAPQFKPQDGLNCLKYIMRDAGICVVFSDYLQ